MPDGFGQRPDAVAPRDAHDDADIARVTRAAIVIGTGFAGLGMAIALRRAGIEDVVVLERGSDVGGVWRENTYPGAGCDVPSHLYSFSFAPNPRWSRMFARQAEIHAYLGQLADAYDIRRHVRLDTAVEACDYDAQAAIWRVTLAGGETLFARIVISGVGQLSRLAMPNIPGMAQLGIPAFHSAHWDHDFSPAGKRIAVVGTGASAIQFVPELARIAASLTLFQRSPAYVIPRPDRPYTPSQQDRFARSPWRMKLHRAQIYCQLESRAIAFTRLGWLMKIAVGVPFQLLLRREIADKGLRKKLTPDYPIGCKRILLSNEYYPALAQPNVELVTTGIAGFTEDGIATVDGTRRTFDAIVYGTGFAATEFLSPMRITGRGGLALNTAWAAGASAYLGLSVPDFPNFFMLYGPNTNLGHNSIIYMLESQIAHVMRCMAHMNATGANSVEIETDRYERRDRNVQKRLAGTVWAGCRSWYVDASGRNSTNWPGFTYTYRWLATSGSLDAYRFARVDRDADTIVPPGAALERATAAFLRGFLRVAFRPVAGPQVSPVIQRNVVAGLSLFMPGTTGTSRSLIDANGVPTRVVVPANPTSDAAILYLHGGAFILGNPSSHRAVTTRLANASGLRVWVPDYRLAPEHPYPAAIDDALACWQAMRASGLSAGRIVVAGDSAGGSLAVALAIRLKMEGQALPAALALISPVTDPTLAGPTVQSNAARDPMIRRGWLEQGVGAYGLTGPAAADAPEHRPLDADLEGLPAVLIQTGDEEILLSDGLRLAGRLRAQGVACRVEIHGGRWHVFHLQAALLSSARRAIRTLGAFAARAIAAPDA